MAADGGIVALCWSAEDGSLRAEVGGRVVAIRTAVCSRHKDEALSHKGIRYVPTRDVQTYLKDVFQASLEPGQTTIPADAPIITRFNDVQ